MSDDLFKFLGKKKAKKSSLIESLLSETEKENHKETEERFSKDNEIINIGSETQSSILDDIERDKGNEGIELTSQNLELENSEDIQEDKGTDILEGANGMRVLTLDEDEDEEEAMTEKMVKITASSPDELKRIEYVIYLLSARNFDEAIEFINNWKSGI